jgi:hypothetical protein
MVNTLLREGGITLRQWKVHHIGHGPLLWSPPPPGSLVKRVALDSVLLSHQTGSFCLWQYDTGIHYVEFRIQANGAAAMRSKIKLGVIMSINDSPDDDIFDVGDRGIAYVSDGSVEDHNQKRRSQYGASYGIGDTIGMKMNFSNMTIEFYKNGQTCGIATESLLPQSLITQVGVHVAASCTYASDVPFQVKIIVSRPPKWGYGVEEAPSPSTTLRLPANAVGYTPSSDDPSSSSTTKRGTGGAAARQSVEWLCPVCTLHNPLEYEECIACGTLLPVCCFISHAHTVQ